MSTQILEPYKVNTESSDLVSLEVSIGDGQLGITSVYLEDKKRIFEKEGDFSFQIGKGKDIDNKCLFISTMVRDVQPGTNKTEVTFGLKNGIKEYQGTLKKEVNSEGGVAFYAAYFIFHS